MTRSLLLPALGLALALAPHARAQNIAPPNANAPSARPSAQDVAAVAASSVVNVGAADLANLPVLLARAGAVSLGAGAADFDQNPAARDALLDYVARGGTIFLHTDAAQFFGYRTVAARATTNQLAGQLYGRARAAVPFGTVPLLNSNDVAANGVVRAPGINRVFYTLRAGDDLVIDHPAGTPLLQISDGTSNRPLYAAAIAPYGAGFAVFTPDFIDQSRGDGAAFARNLLKLVGGARYVGVPQAAIVSGNDLLPALATALQNASGQGAALPGFGTGLPVARQATPGDRNSAPIAQNGAQNNNAPGDVAGVGGVGGVGVGVGGAPNNGANGALEPAAQGPVLLLTRAEATGFGAALQNDPQGRGASALAILRARVALLNADPNAAREQLVLAERLTPQTNEIAFLRGVSGVAGVGFVGSTTADRISSANLAANSFAAAGRATSVFGGPVTTPGNAAGVTAISSDITPDQLGALGAQLNLFSQVLALEPPLSQVLGNGATAVTVRYFAGDASLPFIATALQSLARSEVFRDVLDGQEILLFPTPALYQRYRAAANIRQQNVPNSAVGLGDVADNRILMVAVQPARPAFIGPDGVPRVFPLLPTSASLLARFEAYALLDYYVGDGPGRAPAWMALGLASIADITLNGEPISSGTDQELRRYASANALLTPDQFNAQLGDASLLARSQATQLVRYFYAQFGAGRVAETLQRIGAGQSIDDALVATTGLNETGLFLAWRNAQFGTTIR